MKPLTRKDAEKAKELYERLEMLEDQLCGFGKSDNFTMYPNSGRYTPVPVEPSIAKQIAYKYINEESYNVKQQLKEMGFEYGEKNE